MSKRQYDLFGRTPTASLRETVVAKSGKLLVILAAVGGLCMGMATTSRKGEDRCVRCSGDLADDQRPLPKRILTYADSRDFELVVLFDGTASMGSYYRYLTTALQEILQYALSMEAFFRIGLTAYWNRPNPILFRDAIP